MSGQGVVTEANISLPRCPGDLSTGRGRMIPAFEALGYEVYTVSSREHSLYAAAVVGSSMHISRLRRLHAARNGARKHDSLRETQPDKPVAELVMNLNHSCRVPVRLPSTYVGAHRNAARPIRGTDFEPDRSPEPVLAQFTDSTNVTYS